MPRTVWFGLFDHHGSSLKSELSRFFDSRFKDLIVILHVFSPKTRRAFSQGKRELDRKTGELDFPYLGYAESIFS